MPWRLGLAVLGCALVTGWWIGGARGEPMPPSASEPMMPSASEPITPSNAAAPVPPPGLWDTSAQAANPPAAANPAKTSATPPGETFPYRAAIAAEPAAARSGPGEEFYETGRLRRGEEVEVYRHDPRGWCAIRPPPGSFSYVPAEHLKPVEDGLAETTVAGVKSFVGSSLSNHRDRSHVSLRRGERVEPLEKLPAEGLCKINPPAGEFRWVHEKCLERLGPIAGGDACAAIDQGGVDPSSGAQRSSPAEKWRAAPRTTAFQATDDAQPTNLPTAEIGVGQRSPSGESRPVSVRQSRRPTLPQRGWIRPSSSATEEDDEPGNAPPTPPPAPAEKVEETAPTGLPPGDQLIGAALDQIDLELAKIVCQPKNRWALEPVRDATKEMLRSAETPADRGRARRLLDRIAQFEEVRRQTLGLPATAIDEASFKVTAANRPQPGPDGLRAGAAIPAGDRPSSGPSSAGPATAGGAAPSPTAVETSAAPPLPPNWEDPRFDGSGRLVPLDKRGDTDPQFLLVDDQGVARCFVTAAPGVNLRAYRDRIVGITGSRVEDLERGKPHLTAQRVTLLSDAPPRR